MSDSIPPPPPPSAPPPERAAPSGRREGAARPVRWGVPDVLIAWCVGVGGAIVASIFVLDAGKPAQLIVGLAGQNGAIIAWLVVTARRKGLGSLRRDFGLVLRPADWPWLFAGLGLQLAALLPTALLVTVHGTEAKQDVVNIADRAHGAQIPLIVLAVAVLAPLTEELLFRGVLLRGLLRKVSPAWAVFVAAAVFGLVHLVGDPSVGSLVALPAIMALGVVSAWQAASTGSLSRSILLHVGFNALTVVVLFA